MRRLLEEVSELIVALAQEDKEAIRSESADVANFAMMVADVHQALEGESK